MRGGTLNSWRMVLKLFRQLILRTSFPVLLFQLLSATPFIKALDLELLRTVKSRPPYWTTFLVSSWHSDLLHSNWGISKRLDLLLLKLFWFDGISQIKTNNMAKTFQSCHLLRIKPWVWPQGLMKCWLRSVLSSLGAWKICFGPDCGSPPSSDFPYILRTNKIDTTGSSSRSREWLKIVASLL